MTQHKLAACYAGIFILALGVAFANYKALFGGFASKRAVQAVSTQTTAALKSSAGEQNLVSLCEQNIAGQAASSGVVVSKYRYAKVKHTGNKASVSVEAVTGSGIFKITCAFAKSNWTITGTSAS